MREIVFSKESTQISYPISYINSVVCMYVFKTNYDYILLSYIYTHIYEIYTHKCVNLKKRGVILRKEEIM